MAVLANAGNDACCAKATDLFYKCYARFMYNFVWSTLSFGGIYLVGETATMYPQMLSDIFLPEYFNCVESKRPNLQRIPVYSTNDDVTVGLYGVAHYFLKEKKEMFGGSSFWDRLKNKFFSC